MRTLCVLMAGGSLLVALSILGCQGGANLRPPPGQVAGFVGVDVCAGCHSDIAGQWRETRHAHAVATLDRIGQGGNPTCLRCHTVGRGVQEDSVYVNPIQTPQFQNVQCENCHGPGGNHVEDPGANPMSIILDALLCGKCHTGPHHPTIDEWLTSRHAQALETIRNSRFGKNECLECHSADVILAEEKPTLRAVAQFGITCPVCHNPHEKANDFQLRRPVKTVCTECHRVGNIRPGRTPFQPQKEFLVGTGLAVDATGARVPAQNSTHVLVTEPERCVTCHMFMVAEKDPINQNPARVGHTWEIFSLDVCAQPGCHSSAAAAQERKDEAQAEIGGLLTQAETLLNSIDRDTLSRGDQAKWDRAKFNFELANQEGSRGVHNTRMSRQCLNLALDILAQIP